MGDIKTFWNILEHSGKPLSTFLSTQKMTIIVKEEIIMGDHNTAEVLNTFFSNNVSNLKFEGYSNCDPLANNIRDPVFKCIEI